MLANEEIVGFYSTGPKVKENDLKVLYIVVQFISRSQF